MTMQPLCLLTEYPVRRTGCLSVHHFLFATLGSLRPSVASHPRLHSRQTPRYAVNFNGKIAGNSSKIDLINEHTIG